MKRNARSGRYSTVQTGPLTVDAAATAPSGSRRSGASTNRGQAPWASGFGGGRQEEKDSWLLFSTNRGARSMSYRLRLDQLSSKMLVYRIFLGREGISITFAANASVFSCRPSVHTGAGTDDCWKGERSTSNKTV